MDKLRTVKCIALQSRLNVDKKRNMVNYEFIVVWKVENDECETYKNT